ncbi:MAG: hypothetical protein D5R97_04785 [Candidatus Syntrophonatronum acetioxidans]|uniref:BIG2 domain-containing protein n=1 Tax=Candidatus Syntrophonatronum acetioxidans TaxID=1795816 RepID=A0A424YF14_9FIRM|nr:MAG: hypothetical protein D5R97_04785 [Candidatus Syntrophonatronum acetioxidans]
MNPDDPQNALSNAKDLPNEIVNDIKQYPCDDLEVVEVKAITEKLDLEVDDTKVIEYEVEPVKATVTFESNNTGVATVEDDGKVTAKGEGLATITLTGSYGNYEEGTDTVIVNVREREDIELLSYHEYWDGNYWYVVGEIKNNTDKTAKFVRVDLRGYVNDSIKYTDFTYSSPSELAPGETGAFKFMIRESNAQKFDSFLLFLYWSD